MSTTNVMGSISIERLHSIEREREEVMGSSGYQQWMRELNVSRSYVDPNPIWNARNMNEEYDWSKIRNLQM